MENGERKAGLTYSLSLLLGLVGLIALGLLGLPVATFILLAFAAAVVGSLLYGLRSPA